MKRLVLLLSIAACADERPNVAPLGDYTSWTRFDQWGRAPGHGDTYRIIWVNDTAREPPENPNQPFAPKIDSIVVKEVYKRDADDTPGSLNVIEIMRRTGDDGDDQRGWLFTATDKRGGDESVQDFCWRRCHTAAPFTGAWFDYSKL